MKTVAFVNIKGGVAKTASVTSVAHILATQYNKRVLMIDLDPQANTTARFSNINVYERLERKLHGDIRSIDNSISDLLLKRNIEVHDCIRKTIYENLDIIPSDLQLGDVQDRIKADVTVPPQFRLKGHINKLQDEYDYCIIDCAPSVSIANVNGLAVCDEAYIPTTTDGDSLEGVAYALDLVRTVKDYNEKLEISGCFFTRWENQGVPKMAYELLEEMVPGLLLPFKMYKSKLIGEGSYLNLPLLIADKRKTISKLTTNYLHLTEFIMADDKAEYLREYDEEKSIYLTLEQITRMENEELDISEELQENISRNGICKPITVIKQGKNYILVDGKKRCRVQEKLILDNIWDKYRPIPAKIIER